MTVREATFFLLFNELLVCNLLPGLRLENCRIFQEWGLFHGHKMEVQAIGIETPL